MKGLIAVALAALLFSGATFAAVPPIFNPNVPKSWNVTQRKIALQLLSAFFDACPAATRYLNAVENDARLSLFNAAYRNWWGDDGSFRKYDWRQALVLDLDVNVRFAKQFPKPTIGDDLPLTFYFVAGDRPGIYIFSAPKLAAKMCGSKNVVHWKAAYGPVRSFIPVPAMRTVDDM